MVCSRANLSIISLAIPSYWKYLILFDWQDRKNNSRRNPKYHLSTTTITELLARASEIRKKHELIAEMTGEGFNIFSILGLETAENRTHSAFLRELLDPKGSHGMKDVFLKSFVRMVSDIPSVSRNDETELGWKGEFAANVNTEIHIGYISADGSQGGRIDLVITPTFGGRKIFIENKIEAGDQKYQLVRYYNQDKDALLLYLTLEGKEASVESTVHPGSGMTPEASTIEPDNHYFPISYKTHILGWLEECKKESSGRPLVRETIAQYITLIRNLTQQSISHQMDNDIEKIIVGTADMFAASKKIGDAYYTIYNRLNQKINISEHIFVCDWRTHKIYSFFGLDGGPYISFQVHDHQNNQVLDQTNPEFDEIAAILNRMGFSRNRSLLGWKHCSHWQDEKRLWELCRLSADKAFEELQLEQEEYIKKFKEEAEK